MKRTLSIILLFLILVGGGALLKLHAQNANPGLVVYPSNFDLTYTGKPSTNDITLLNNTDQAITIKVSLKNFTAQGEEGAVALSEENSSFSLASWITVNPLTQVIQPKKSGIFSFTITPPKNVEAGGHFGSIVFSTVPNPKISGTGAVVAQQVASLVLFKIPGNANEKAYVESFATDQNFYEFGPVTFNLRVKNTGDIHIVPVGQVVIKGTFGDKYFVNLEPRNVLPNAARKIPAVLNNKLLVGMYTATFTGAYGAKNHQLNAYTEFSAFPIRYGLIILGVLIILFLFRKRLWKTVKILLTGK